MVNTISVVSLVSLLLPVAAVIILLSIFNGFGSLVESISCASQSDLTVRLKRGRLFSMDQIDTQQLRQIGGVEALSFVTEQTMMLQRGGRTEVVTMRGVDGEFADVVDIKSFVGVGRFGTDDENWIALSGSMPYQLGINTLSDSEVELFALKTGRLQSLIPAPSYRSQSGVVRGVVYIDDEHDQRYGYASQRFINDLLSRDGVASRLMIRVDKARESEVRAAIESRVGEQFEVVSRSELNAAIFEVVRYEKFGIMVIAMLVMLLATFTLMGAETMLIVERRRDISTLATLGLTRNQLRSVFVVWGAIISFIAIVLGLALGLGVALLQQHFKLLMLPLNSTMTMAYPVEVQVGDIIYVVVSSWCVTFVLSSLVARLLIDNDLNS